MLKEIFLKNICFCLAVIFALISGCALAAPEQNGFHPPQTEAEKALDRALWIEDMDGTERFQEVLAWLKGQGDPHSIRYGDYFTRHYLKKWSETQADMAPYCKNHADDPSLCEPSSLTCNPFSNRDLSYGYMTLKVDGNKASIAFSPLDWEESGGVFSMATEGGVWKIDGTDCDINKWRAKK